MVEITTAGQGQTAGRMEPRREALLREYGEVTANFRNLADIRFRLLGLLPLAAVATAALKGDNSNVSTLALSLFGLIATVGLITYNARNDQLYDELVGRAGDIERQLGLPDGGFANRMLAWLEIELVDVPWKVDHRTGIDAIYGATVALWLFGVLGPLVALVPYDVCSPAVHGDAATLRIHLVAMALAIAMTGFAMVVVGRQKKAREDRIRQLAAAAVAKAVRLRAHPSWPLDESFLRLCASMREREVKDLALVRRRAAFLHKLPPDEAAKYMVPGDRRRVAAQYVALLADFSPRWVMDAATDRRGTRASARAKARERASRKRLKQIPDWHFA